MSATVKLHPLVKVCNSVCKPVFRLQWFLKSHARLSTLSVHHSPNLMIENGSRSLISMTLLKSQIIVVFLNASKILNPAIDHLRQITVPAPMVCVCGAVLKKTIREEEGGRG